MSADIPVVIVGEPFTTTIVAPPDTVTEGRPVIARVEDPVTRAIVSPAHFATRSGDNWEVTLDGPLLAGAYELVWMTSDDPPTWQVFEPLTVVDAGTVGAAPDWPAIPVDQVTPTVDTIGRLLATRLRTEGGETRDTFTADTIVTASQVTALIGDAVELILAELPEQIDPELYPRVKYAIALQAAILVETSYFRLQEGSSTGSGVIATYTRLLTATLARLVQVDRRYVGLS